MPLPLRQSTAVTVTVGPFIGTDALTESTALSSQTGRVVKNGTSSSLTPSSWSHQENGNYAVGLSTSHTDTIGLLRVRFQSSASYLPVWADFEVLHANVYDAWFGTTALSTYAGADTSGTTTLLSRVSSTRAGYLDNLSAGAVAQASALASLVTTVGAAGAGLTAVGDTAGTTTLLSRLTGTRAGYLDNLSSVPATAGDVAASTATITFDTAALLSRLTSTRAGYLDNLSAAPATASALASLVTTVGVAGAGLTAVGDTSGTTTLLSRLTSGRAGYLDNLATAPATAGDAMALTSGERSTLAAAILDLADGVESGETLRQWARLVQSVLAGRAVVSEETGQVEFRRKDGSTVALTVVHDAIGNRTSSTTGTL